ncbi:hypothetical protein G6F62_008759 [Rhizopus arrhizus]|nr:hypothetical protein G6F62_008759 [Rhizopus arrhizus]
MLILPPIHLMSSLVGGRQPPESPKSRTSRPESTATYSPFVHHRKDAIEPDAYSSAASSPQLSLHDTQPRLPTPPAMVVDHQDDHWGVQLPPLRAIMNDDYKNTLSTSLILPPPIASKYLIEPYSRY